jgi:hypothetical protein
MALKLPRLGIDARVDASALTCEVNCRRRNSGDSSSQNAMIGASNSGITPPTMKIQRHCEAASSILIRLATAPPKGVAL